MNEHSNGRENATQLEQRLSDHGVLYQSAECNGFIVVGDDRIFIVEEEQHDSPENFCFRKIPFDEVEQFRVELGEPDDRYSSNEDAEKVTDGGNAGPTTHIRLYLPTDAVDCYVDTDPREVASAFVTFSLEEDD